MNILFSWLKDFVDLQADGGVEIGPDELAERLTMVGLETNVLKGLSGGMSELDSVENVVVARIEKIEPHPNADKLLLCRVKASEDDESLPIVCGAPNIKEGDVVPLALAGARLAKGFKVEKTKIRGQVSHGMMCSERELGIGDDHSGIMILSPDLPLGKPLAEVLAAGGEILEFDITPNRGDALSVIGVAREIAALLEKPLKYPEFQPKEDGPDISDVASVTIEDYQGCPRYVARLVQGVKIGPSPSWMVERLEAGGIRAINNVVDVTNYILLELGQPLHAFDFHALRRGKIVVRCAERGEKFKTLDGEERTLDSDSLLICDGEGPVALAGIMGGLDSEVIESTTDVLIESAFFNPVSIRRTSQKLGLSTEASYRFERTVDPLGQAKAADRAARLMAEACGGRVCKGSLDVYEQLQKPKEIHLRPNQIYRHVGVEMDASECAGFLNMLGIESESVEGGLNVRAPSFRPDIEKEIDLVEEIARLYGYDRLEATLPRFSMEPMRTSPQERLRMQWAELLADIGFTEVVNYNFDDMSNMDRILLPEDHPARNAVRILNPLNENECVMRYSMIPRLLDNLKYNLSRDMKNVMIFEFNKVFAPGKDMAVENNMLSGVLSRGEREYLWSEVSPGEGFYEIKGVIETLIERLNFPGARLVNMSMEKNTGCHFIAPKKGMQVMMGKQLAGFFGELHPSVQENFGIEQKAFIFDLNFDILVNVSRPHRELGKPSKYPGVKRDVALVADEDVTAEDVIRVIRQLKSGLVESAYVFDVYRGGNIPEGKKSMAFRILYQSRERTLTDEEVNALHAKLTRRIEERLGVKIR